MEAQHRSTQDLATVRIFPLEDGWAVGCGTGHFSIALPKAQALKQAADIAMAANVREIAVYDENGHCIEWLSVEPTPPTHV